MSEEVRWPSMCVTGGAGVIGRVLRTHWRGPLVVYDLPDHDARDLPALTETARGHDVLVHLAWDTTRENFRNNGFDSDNLVMTVNALEAALAAGVGRVLLASSVHADRFWPPAAQRLDPAREPMPDSPYGASKVFMEALGRHFAADRGLEVVAIRFGGVNARDIRPDDPAERAVFLPHADCVDVIRTVATAPLPDPPYGLVIGVGDSPDRLHDYGALWPRR